MDTELNWVIVRGSLCFKLCLHEQNIHTRYWTTQDALGTGEPLTGISYLVSKSIATVINKQLIGEKYLPLQGHYRRCARENKALWPTSQIRLASKSFFGNKTDNPNQYPGVLPGHNIFIKPLNHLLSVNISFHSVYLKWFERCSWTARFLGHQQNIHDHVYRPYIFYTQHRRGQSTRAWSCRWSASVPDVYR
jgi:hypothetical protein